MLIGFVIQEFPTSYFSSKRAIFGDANALWDGEQVTVFDEVMECLLY